MWVNWWRICFKKFPIIKHECHTLQRWSNVIITWFFFIYHHFFNSWLFRQALQWLEVRLWQYEYDTFTQSWLRPAIIGLLLFCRNDGQSHCKVPLLFSVLSLNFVVTCWRWRNCSVRYIFLAVRPAPCARRRSVVAGSPPRVWDPPAPALAHPSGSFSSLYSWRHTRGSSEFSCAVWAWPPHHEVVLSAVC